MVRLDRGTFDIGRDRRRDGLCRGCEDDVRAWDSVLVVGAEVLICKVDCRDRLDGLELGFGVPDS